MELPSNFTKVIADTFYDKVITVYSEETVKDSFGWTKQSASPTSTTFNGNVRYTNLRQLQEDYGIKEDIDVAITTSYSIENGKIIGIGDTTYKIVSVIPSDSHNLVVAKKWFSKSTTLTSA